jgi:hypothetical protein
MKLVILSAFFARRTYATPDGMHRFFASLRMTMYELRTLDGTAEGRALPGCHE